MPRERIFIDTSYIQGLLNGNDQYHELAAGLFRRVQAADTWITEAVLLEIGNAFSRINRVAATSFIRHCYDEQSITVVPMTADLMRRGLALYEQSQDKEWGLVDCISFEVMRDSRILLAATTDRHFEQAGFMALMRNT